ncbi:alpha/beta hydrolase [Cytophagaceae bacterium ABcell3]|nr:alpha/beta hydrolase [Cytophagaceae bacterium ABcell3]
MENYYKVNRIKLHVVEDGPEDGKAIIFLHGFPEFWYSWKAQIPYFTQRGYRVIVPDQRGYNLSDKPVHVKNYQIKELVRDIVELIETAEQKQVYLVGHDWGGTVAWKLAEAYPQLIFKLIIINMPHPKVFKETIKKNLKQRLTSSYILIAQLPWIPEKILKWTNYKVLLKSMDISSSSSTFKSLDRAKYKEAWSHKNSLKYMINWYRAAKYSKEPDENITIRVPVLVIWGNQDKFFRENTIQASLKMCKDAHLYRTEGTHWLHHEKPEEVNNKILEFIK